MVSNAESVLHFNHYDISEFIFVKNENFGDYGIEELPMQYAFSGQVEVNDEKNAAMVTLTCEVFHEDFTMHQVPFFIKITIRGHFGLSGATDIAQFQINSIAILMPYLRATISSFTAQAGINPVSIPIMNVSKMFNNVEEQEESAEDSSIND